MRVLSVYCIFTDCFLRFSGKFPLCTGGNCRGKIGKRVERSTEQTWFEYTVLRRENNMIVKPLRSESNTTPESPSSSNPVRTDDSPTFFSLLSSIPFGSLFDYTRSVVIYCRTTRGLVYYCALYECVPRLFRVDGVLKAETKPVVSPSRSVRDLYRGHDVVFLLCFLLFSFSNNSVRRADAKPQ